MKLLIGLGNPGTDHAHNRHNVGHLFVDYVKENGKAHGPDWKILKTDTFMNESGKFIIKKIAEGKSQAADLYLVHDDLDIPLGKFKIQFGVGPKVHNGVESVENSLGTKEFWRVRIGVDHRESASRTPGDKYVLENFTPEEQRILAELFPQIWEEVSRAVT